MLVFLWFNIFSLYIYHSLFSRLFCVIKNRQSRVELCNIFNSIKEIDASYTFIAKLVHDVRNVSLCWHFLLHSPLKIIILNQKLNAWDVKRIEEPDYMLRLDGFKQLNLTIKDWECFDTKLASILIYNCFFFLNNVKLSLLKLSSQNV